jgi:hypothetical protein
MNLIEKITIKTVKWRKPSVELSTWGILMLGFV